MDNYSADKHKWEGRLDVFTVDVSCVMDRYTSLDDNSRDFLPLFGQELLHEAYSDLDTDSEQGHLFSEFWSFSSVFKRF